MDTNRKPISDFLLLIHYFMPIFYRFRDKTIYLSKICICFAVLLTQVSFEALAREFLWDLLDSPSYRRWKQHDHTLISFESIPKCDSTRRIYTAKEVFISTQLNSTQLNWTQLTQLNSVQPSQSCFCLWRHDLQTESTGSLRSLIGDSCSRCERVDNSTSSWVQLSWVVSL